MERHFFDSTQPGKASGSAGCGIESQRLRGSKNYSETIGSVATRFIGSLQEKMSLKILLTICLLAFLFAFGLGSNVKPNIVLITIDTLRADHLGCYGYNQKTSPVIDQFALRGLRFQNAYSAVPITLASHATILTGVYPNKHGYRDNAFFAPTSSVLVSEILERNGYQTAAFVSGAPLSGRFGLNRGFDYYDD